MPEKTAAMNQQLTDILTEMKASYPYYNPNFSGDLPGKEKVCVVLSHKQYAGNVEFKYKETVLRLSGQI